MSGLPGLRFRYALEPLLTKQRWDVDALAVELQAAVAARESTQRQVAAVERAIGAIDDELTRLRAEGAVLDLDREQRLRTFRSSRVQALADARGAAEAATRQLDRVRQQLTDASLRLRGYERHRSQQHQAHDGEQRRLAQREADEAWLLTRRVERGRS
jgi:flagellar biosynthesis chaperone FliJ